MRLKNLFLFRFWLFVILDEFIKYVFLGVFDLGYGCRKYYLKFSFYFFLGIVFIIEIDIIYNCWGGRVLDIVGDGGYLGYWYIL